jgi:hypothetical protein
MEIIDPTLRNGARILLKIVRPKPAIPRTRHDLLVRFVFGRPKATVIEMRHALPSTVLDELDLDTLARVSSSYARPRRGPLDSDLLFTVRLRGFMGSSRIERPSIYFSLDHQSNPDRLFPWRSHVYTGELWGRHIEAHSPPRLTSLPFVLPLVLVQHPARNLPTRLSDILDVPDHVREAFGAPFEAVVHIDDLSGSVLDDPVADPGHLALVEITRALLFAYRNPRALEDPRLARLGPLFDTVLRCFGRDEVEELLAYVLHVFGERSPIVAIIIRTLGRAVKEMYVTLADKLRAEGRKEGRASATAEAVLAVLRHRYGSVPAGVRRRVLATVDERRLQRWLGRALSAGSLEEVLGSLEA